MSIDRSTHNSSSCSDIPSGNAASRFSFFLLAAALGVFLFLCCRAAGEPRLSGPDGWEKDRIHFGPAALTGETGSERSAIRTNSADSVRGSARSEQSPRLAQTNRIQTLAAILLLLSLIRFLLSGDSGRPSGENRSFLFQLFTRASLPARAGPFFA